ncbi:hypothetical protein B0H65DRAFT_481548 [Neurospora tetraspora]|uniref:Uncharacterized protein n=1 Tax=Neurospora tetraspora TaxID=94610 RepID=A0AAE0IZS8_9PEZI|nr:hypothetical protein B0H65DRAFT_481548 [Neurospora tetraspora]
MVASGLCRVAATARVRRPASWVTFKSAVIVHHPLRHHLAHRIRIHPHHREFLRPTTASSAPQLAVTEQPDRLALEAPPCLPSRSLKAKKWRKIRDATSKALECLTDINKTQQDIQEALQVLVRTYNSVSGFYTDIKVHTTAYRDFAACRTAVDIAGSAVEAREALWEADVNLKEAQKELDLALAPGADAQDVELKAEQVRTCEAARTAREKEFREANEAVLESSGIFLNTPHPQTRKQAEIKREDYEWMLRAVEEILKYRDWLYMKAKQLRAASIAADKLNRSCEAGKETAATPIEQSANEQIEQPAEAEQHNDMENVRERPTPIEEYEDEPERVKNLESSKLYQRPTIRLNETTTETKSIQLKDSLVDHYPPIAFPFKVTTTVMETLHKLFEECCYQFALAHIPHHLAERNWDCPEAVELSTWHWTFSELLRSNPRYVFAFDTDYAFEKAVPARRRVTYVYNHLLALKVIRNQTVHPRPLNPMVLPKILRRAGELARLFRDRRLQQDIQQLSSEITRVLAALQTRRAESLKAGRTHELYHQIVADKAAVQRIRNRLPSPQVSASQERWAACAMFEKDIERLMEALPVAIQADEEARLQAELPPLVEMAEKMAAQVEKRNAEMQLRLEAVRKSRSDMVLGTMQFVLDKHVRRMRNGWFPYFKPLGRERELGVVGSPLPSAEQGGPQEKLEPHERHGHQEHPEPQEQQDEKAGLGLSCLEKTSHARRAMIRNALARDLQREERECEREQANADVDAHADATGMPTEEERFRPGCVPSIPEEEMWNAARKASEEENPFWVQPSFGASQYLTEQQRYEPRQRRQRQRQQEENLEAAKWNDEAADKFESGDMAPDGYRATTSAFFEMLERREKPPVEDFKKRAMKEMAAAAAKATKAEQEGENEEQVEAGEDRRTFMKFLNEYKALSEENFMKKGMSRRAAGLAYMKQSRALEREYIWQRRTLEKQMKILQEEIFMIGKEMKLLNMEKRRLEVKREREKAKGEMAKAEKKQGRDDEDKNKNELEPAAVDDVDDKAAINDGIKALAELAIKRKKLMLKIESLKERKRTIRGVSKKFKELDSARPIVWIKIDHTEKAATDGPSSHLVAKEADFDSPIETGPEAARDGGDLPAVGSEVTDVDVNVDTNTGTELTETEAGRTSIEEGVVDADVEGASFELSPEEAAMKAFLDGRQTQTQTRTQAEAEAAQEVAEEVAPKDTGLEASVEAIPAGEVAVEKVATLEISVVEPFNPETTALQEVTAEETALTTTSVNEETPPLFLPTPRPPRGEVLDESSSLRLPKRSLRTLPLYLCRRTSRP